MRTHTLVVKLSQAEMDRVRAAAQRVGESTVGFIQSAAWEAVVAEQNKRIAKLKRALRKIARDGDTDKLYAWDIPAYAKKVLKEIGR